LQAPWLLPLIHRIFLLLGRGQPVERWATTIASTPFGHYKVIGLYSRFHCARPYRGALNAALVPEL
jgi:hypothetical protein